MSAIHCPANKDIVMRILVILLLLPSLAFAWGDKGHKLVAALAWEQLPLAVKSEVMTLLSDGTESSAGEKEKAAGKKTITYEKEQQARDHAQGLLFQEAAVWADEVKGQSRYKHLKKLHYVNLPEGVYQYKAARDCKKNRCIVEAIKKYQIEYKDKSLPIKDRRLALRMLIHLVGDIHQPFHAGFGHDRGGNKLKVSFFGEATNIHQLWDRGLIYHLKLSREKLLSLRASNIIGVTEPSSAQAKELSPVVWAQESHRLVKGLYPGVSSRKAVLGKNYALAHQSLVTKQLMLASERLVGVLSK
jgi:hypothetical protein